MIDLGLLLRSRAISDNTSVVSPSSVCSFRSNIPSHVWSSGDLHKTSKKTLYYQYMDNELTRPKQRIRVVADSI
jgi:hypothetical protein